MDQPDARVSLGDISRFFIPLALTSMLTMFTHTIISAGLSRTPNPAVSISAYAVALGLAEIFESPLVLLRQVVLSFFQANESYKTLWRVYLVAAALLSIVALLIGTVPVVSYLILRRVLGVTAELFPATLGAFRVLLLLPVVSGFRCMYQGVLIFQRKTLAILTGMLFRVGVMALLVFSFTRYNIVSGALVGAIAIMSGVVAEGVSAFFHGARHVPTIQGTKTTHVWRFYLPLVSSALLFSTGKPFLNSVLARMPDSSQGLAAFAVASSLAWLVISPAQNLHQVAMVYGRRPEHQIQVIKFSLGYALLASTLLALFSYSALGHKVLTHVLGIPLDLVGPTLLAMRTLALLPLALAWQDYNIGFLLISQSTRLVGLSKVSNLVFTIVFVLWVTRYFSGPTVAPLAQLVGCVCSGLILQLGRVKAQKISVLA